MKKLGLVLILFATLILVGVATFNILQTSHYKNLLDFVISLVGLAIPPSVLTTIIIAVMTHRKEIF